MKTNPLLAGLAALFFLSAVATIFLATRHFFALVELERIQIETTQARATAGYAQSLANDALRYSEAHPEINPLLDEFRKKAANDMSSPFGTDAPQQ